MKKLLLTLVAAAAVSLASAQNKTTFGISGGVNFAKISISYANTSLTGNTASVTSFAVGFFADSPIGSENVSIQPGLYYTGKGGKLTYQGDSFQSNIYYLQVPVNLVYNLPFKTGKAFFGAGPYAGYALNGKNKLSGGGMGTATISQDIEFGSNGQYKRTDFGLTGLFGVNFKNGLLLKATYDLGLTNIAAENTSGEKNKNLLIGLAAGFTF